jgi:prepilin peptidase CpaA
MHPMNWIAPTALVLEILLLLYVAMIDIATRLIHNEICLILALLGIASQFATQTHVTESLAAATILFLLLIVVYQRGWIGGGDVKLLVALAMGLPLMGVIRLLTITALAGGVLALAHLMMRLLPYPKPAASPPLQ